MDLSNRSLGSLSSAGHRRRYGHSTGTSGPSLSGVVVVSPLEEPPLPPPASSSSSSSAGPVLLSTSTNTTTSSSGASDQAAQAAASLQRLLREDVWLEELGMTRLPSSRPSTTTTTKLPADSEENDQGILDPVPFAYAAAWLHRSTSDSQPHAEEEDRTRGRTSEPTPQQQQRAEEALHDVQRKLALVESLAVKLSRTKPEAVAGHLLRLHGYHHPGSSSAVEIPTSEGWSSLSDDPTTTTAPTTSTTTLTSVRERADRLERQAAVLDTVAQRVEGTLTRGHGRMVAACTRLERVLQISTTLKQLMRLQFEATKLQTYYDELVTMAAAGPGDHHHHEDVRDLIKAAASLAVVEELLQQDELQPPPPSRSSRHPPLRVLERLRPPLQQAAVAVRQAAARGWQTPWPTRGAPPPTAWPDMAATLQVYYHLHELPAAVYQTMEKAHQQAEAACRQLFNPVTLTSLNEQAKKAATEPRHVPKRLRQLRGDLAQSWAVAEVGSIWQHVRAVQQVLMRKSDPVRRERFLAVVARAPLPKAYAAVSTNTTEFSLLALFWGRFCQALGPILEQIVRQDQGKFKQDVAALYPALRAAAWDMLTDMVLEPAGVLVDDGRGEGGQTVGIMGGSAILQDAFLQGSSPADPSMTLSLENPQAADAWTPAPAMMMMASPSTSRDVAASTSSQRGSGATSVSGATAAALLQSREWKTLQGTSSQPIGLYPLQQAFVQSCSDRLHAPLQYMFPAAVTLDEGGVAVSAGLSLLPSKYDIQRFDENIRQELALADPREGGSDYTLVSVIAECIVRMITQFCQRASHAVSGASDRNYVASDWTMTDSLQHDRKVVAIMYTVAENLKGAADKTFLAPYRPTILPQQEAVARLCQESLVLAVEEIDRWVHKTVLTPLYRALNQRISVVLAKMHLGVYMGGPAGGNDLDEEAPAFVQKNLSDVYEAIAQNHLSRLPPPYASSLADTIAKFSMYAFVSHACLVQPLGEAARLHITQDLADLELALEQLALKSGGSTSLSQIGQGRPYAELRAVRQMLFWTGLDSRSTPASDVAKSLLREVWLKDVRPSTVLHYLFSFGPSLLSSPHHSKRQSLEEYVSTLVKPDGSVDAGEDSAWITILSCCDLYQQRSSTSGVVGDGDPRVAAIIQSVGQELQRRGRR